MSVSVDFRPRRIWLGVTVPGKKMVRALGYGGLEAGGSLNDLYENEPYMVLYAVAYALREVPRGHGATGPAARDLLKPLTPGAGLFGALVTDIRDFLKLRFRATGLDQRISAADIIRDFPQTTTPAEVFSRDPAWVINYLISGLDGLSRSPDAPTSSQQFYAAIKALRDVARFAGKALNPRRGLQPRADEIMDQAEDEDFATG